MSTFDAERASLVSLALQLRRQWHERRRWAVEARATGNAAKAAQYADAASRQLDNARWYLAKAMDRRPLSTSEN